MNNLHNRIFNLKESQMRDTAWYSLGSVCSSASSMLILLIVTRIMGADTSGMFSLSWSAAQLMLTIGWFSSRQYMVSDVNKSIGYNEYRVAKVLSSITMLVIGVIYTFIYGYESDARITTVLLCVMMIAEVFADFYSSYFQSNNKLYIGGMSYVIRYVGYMLVFTVSLLLGKSLVISILLTFAFQAVWLTVFDLRFIKFIPNQNNTFVWRNVFKLFLDCVPLFIGSFVASFIMNIPKNAIDLYMDYSTQASYNILFMPTAVINMFNMFISVPFYTKLAQFWQSDDKSDFLKILYKLVGFVAALTAMFLLGGTVVGIPVLSWLYNVDLSSCRLAFAILLLGGGFYGVSSILTYVITVFRKQRIILYIYLICAAVSQLTAGSLVKGFGITGAAVSYTASMAVISLGLAFYIFCYLKKTTVRLTPYKNKRKKEIKRRRVKP